jgi:hypothetical protein
MNVALMIVLAVMTFLGIIYGIGLGFGIDSLKSFVRIEIIESIFNVVLIAVVGSGLAFSNGAMAFLIDISGVGFGASTTTLTNSQSVYSAICNSYINDGAERVMPYVISSTASLTLLNTFKSIVIFADPVYFGFEGMPFAGLEPVSNLLDMQMDFFMLMIGFFIAVPVILWLIFNLFPWFLYAGILLRSFPWTRTAGGSLMALFIAFYIIFPAVMLPFTTYTVNGNVDQSPWSGQNVGQILSYSFASITGILTVFFGGVFGQVQSFGIVASNLAVQMLGLLVSLLVSLDMVEVLGRLLGAPSLHTRKLFSKVI